MTDAPVSTVTAPDAAGAAPWPRSTASRRTSPQAPVASPPQRAEGSPPCGGPPCAPAASGANSSPAASRAAYSGPASCHAETMEAEPVVHALLEDAAETRLPVHQHHARARQGGGARRRHARGAAAHDRHVAGLAAGARAARRGHGLAAHQVDVVAPRVHHHGRVDAALVERLRRQPRLARHDLHGLRRAEPSMAATHHGARAPLERVERQHGHGSVQGGHQLRLGHLAAAAHHVPPTRVGGDGARPLVLGQVGEGPNVRAPRIERGALPRLQQVGHVTRHLHGHGRRRREARGVEAGHVEESGGVRRLADHEVSLGAACAQAGEVRDQAALAHARPRLARGVHDEAQTLFGGGHVGLGELLHGIGAHEQVAMHRGRHQHALAHRRRRLEHGAGERRPPFRVVQAVFAPSGRDAKPPLAHQVVDLVGEHPRRVHHGARHEALPGLGGHDVAERPASRLSAIRSLGGVRSPCGVCGSHSVRIRAEARLRVRPETRVVFLDGAHGAHPRVEAKPHAMEGRLLRRTPASPRTGRRWLPSRPSKAPFTDGFTCGSMARTASPESSLTPSTPLLLARAASDLTAAISSSENASTSEPLRRYAKPRLRRPTADTAANPPR